mmetsp:Transcript_44344/g.120830  ORF Transcript_44344/g.120830 Transcript_44344/m.120830 type:complete len:202 (-) Transcript_44344:217-822(-)
MEKTDYDLIGHMYGSLDEGWHISKFFNESQRQWVKDIMNDPKRGQDERKGQQATSIAKAWWPLLRVSKRFVNGALLPELMTTGSAAHHEAITGTLCAYLDWCSIGHWNYAWNGEFTLGGWGPFAPKFRKRQNLKYVIRRMRRDGSTGEGVPKPNHLYHPVKCEADPWLGKKALGWLKGSKGALASHPDRTPEPDAAPGGRG